MYFKHTNRPGFLLGAIDFMTAGIFFLIYMPVSLQKEIDCILGRKTQRYWVAYLIGIPTLFLYTLIWMAKVCEETKEVAVKLGIKPKTSFWHMLLWNILGMLVIVGPAVATYGYFATLNAIERKLNEENNK